jgi:putative membrane protein
MHPYYDYAGSGGYGMDAGFGLFGFVFHIIGLVLLVLFVVWLFRMFGGKRGHRFHLWQSHSALTILNERFAKGEIDQKEYEDRKKVLMGEVK